ncbi:MAG: deoxyguanosinetriphosphate triphosphohydrolase [Moorellales bacterium]
MGIREQQEEWEVRWLSSRAAKSALTRGRRRPEERCPIRTEFQRDRDRIIHSKAFRRLKHKTQVFIAPEGDHFRTRLTHTLEVAQIARTIARALRLNEDLTEAIALGHDLGHTPFGHAGEEALDRVHPPGFRHNEQSLRVVEVLEDLNLTWEVRDGILYHTGKKRPHTLEGEIVRLADRIAYINHDIDDALRGGVLTEADLPRDCLEVLGWDHRSRINTMVTDVILQGAEPGIRMSPAVQKAMDRLREFLFERVYVGSAAKQEEGKAKLLVQQLYYHYTQHPEQIPESISPHEADPARRAVDYIAGMTDTYAVNRYLALFVPGPFRLPE